jgi:enoyl-CoA hydratase/carnithine racemase
MSGSEPVVFEELACANGSRLGMVTLNRPRQLNALNLEMCERMLVTLRAWASDAGIAAVLLQGAGERGFCAGGDVAEVVRHVRAGGDRRYVYGDAFFEVEYQLDLLLHTYPKPLVSWSHGVCMGGGVGLVAGCSHRIVSEQSRIAMPEIHIGLFPDVGGGWFLGRVPGGIGRVMALTGLVLNEADALFAGLADYFIAAEAREAVLAEMLAAPWSGNAVEDGRWLTHALMGWHRRHRAGLPLNHLQQYFDALRFIAMQPTLVGVRDALAAAAADDPWFAPAARSLAEGSPTAAWVTDEYLRRARQRSLPEVLALDLVLARQFQRHPDFPEGVRALLIDKDRQPRWSHTDLGAVPPEVVASHFV